MALEIFFRIAKLRKIGRVSTLDKYYLYIFGIFVSLVIEFVARKLRSTPLNRVRSEISVLLSLILIVGLCMVTLKVCRVKVYMGKFVVPDPLHTHSDYRLSALFRLFPPASLLVAHLGLNPDPNPNPKPEYLPC